MNTEAKPYVSGEFPDAAHRPSSRDLPSLDGLRAVSIAFVILGHASGDHVSAGVSVVLARLAHFGVCVFFAISGYLITMLLWREQTRRGSIDLRRFYLRRTLRIFPPYYAYLAVIALCTAIGLVTPPTGTRWWPAITYLSNFFNPHWGLIGHGWSLSLEEQFYLTWPVALVICCTVRGTVRGAQLGHRIAAWSLLAFPFVRALVFLLSRNGELTGAVLFDYVAAGSGIALILTSGVASRLQRLIGAIVASRFGWLTFPAAMISHLVFAGTTRWLFAIDLLLVTPIEAALLAIFVAWAVAHPLGLSGRLLNRRSLRVIGVGSYSLYVWQQLFIGPGAAFTLDWAVGIKLLCAGGCAFLSYWLIERPSLFARARLERKLT